MWPKWIADVKTVSNSNLLDHPNSIFYHRFLEVSCKGMSSLTLIMEKKSLLVQILLHTVWFTDKIPRFYINPSKQIYCVSYPDTAVQRGTFLQLNHPCGRLLKQRCPPTGNRLLFTWSKHVIVGFPCGSLRQTGTSVSCQTHFVHGHSSGTLSSLEFHFPKWLHIQETCVDMLPTSSPHASDAALLFWNPLGGEAVHLSCCWFTVSRNVLYQGGDRKAVLIFTTVFVVDLQRGDFRGKMLWTSLFMCADL